MDKDLQQLKNQVAQLSEKLLESEKMKSHFIAHITNELINPFTSIVNLAQIALKSPTPLNTDVRELVNMILQEGAFLEFQLRNLFYAARLEAGELFPSYSTFRLEDLIDDVINTLKHKSEKKNITLDFSLKFQYSDITTDRFMLKLILLNLLDNAIVKSEYGTTVIFNSENNEVFLHVEVINECVPLDLNVISTIFDRFRRGDNTINSLNQGSGIGLSLSLALAEMLNGTIQADPLEKGMKFSLNLPFPKNIFPDKESDLTIF